MGTKINREGEVNSSKYGGDMLIVKYNTNVDLWVKFLDHGNLIHTNYISFKNGNVRSPYHKTVFGVGYIGEGKYKVSINGKITARCTIWRGMLMRCYNEKYQEKRPTYKNCKVSKEWHNYQNFGEWYDENYYEIEDERMCLDKDILFKGNKIYSPETCVFVPQRINNLFLKSELKRGSLPIGVHFDKPTLKYASKCSDGNKKEKHLGYHNTPDEAFQAYKIYKEKLIKTIANEHKDKIPKKVYDALINYKVEITD